MQKQSRTWDVYVGLMQGLNDMAVALPLVQDLRDEAMRDRHWKKLMRICGKSFVMDEKFCLKHLLALQLQAYVSAVGETVEQARMELKIDKQLARIDATWMSLHLEYELFKSTGVQVLKTPTQVVEALDDHEVALQNMMGSRFMSFFEAQISSWKTKLAGVRSVLESWMDVQRQWCSLEAIFIGCTCRMPKIHNNLESSTFRLPIYASPKLWLSARSNSATHSFHKSSLLLRSGRYSRAAARGSQDIRPD